MHYRQQGGDETKAFWIMKIADLRVLDYYNPELMSYTDKFWNETLFSKIDSVYAYTLCRH